MGNSTNESSPSPPVFPFHLRVLKLSLYVIIFVTSLVANILVCTVILRRKKMKTVTNYFILNLAIADLTLNCVCIPFDIPVQELNSVWPYGSLMCKILYPIQTLLLFASVNTLTAVSLARQRAVVYPMKKQLSKFGAKIIIIGLWLFSLIPVIPYFQALKFNPELHICEESWDDSTTTKVYTSVIFFFHYLLPFSIMFTAYFSISQELKRRAENGNQHMKGVQELEARKVVRMLKVVTTLFALCVLPNNVMWFWRDYGDAESKCKYFGELVAFTNILIFANSAANPICYTILNENYRQEISRLIACGSCKLQGVLSKKENRAVNMQLSNEEAKKRSSTMSSYV
ncbi:orexin receptor type 1-like [Stylophora pistillata]|uniref:orexin receptor type 1-like n=1 Tax=Stylophora pistillata TaxID=50429 RepID=UPI000C04E091|nr:orexin receptor type 1-like [Stylophora pistillata]